MPDWSGGYPRSSPCSRKRTGLRTGRGSPLAAWC